MPGKAVPYAQWPPNEELRIWRVVRDLEETVSSLSGGGTTTGTVIVLPVTTVTGDATLTNANGLVLADATAAALTLTLPAASGNTGLVLEVKKIDVTANTVTVQSAFSEDIDGGGSAVISTSMTALSFASDGSSWWII
jgi:hypothetical protein